MGQFLIFKAFRAGHAIIRGGLGNIPGANRRAPSGLG